MYTMRSARDEWKPTKKKREVHKATVIFIQERETRKKHKIKEKKRKKEEGREKKSWSFITLLILNHTTPNHPHVRKPKLPILKHTLSMRVWGVLHIHTWRGNHIHTHAHVQGIEGRGGMVVDSWVYGVRRAKCHIHTAVSQIWVRVQVGGLVLDLDLSLCVIMRETLERVRKAKCSRSLLMVKEKS